MAEGMVGPSLGRGESGPSRDEAQTYSAASRRLVSVLRGFEITRIDSQQAAPQQTKKDRPK
jgi:hypothetical protein